VIAIALALVLGGAASAAAAETPSPSPTNTAIIEPTASPSSSPSPDNCNIRSGILSTYTPVIDYATGGLLTVKGTSEYAANDPVLFSVFETDSSHVIFNGSLDPDNRVDLDVSPTINTVYEGRFSSGGPKATSETCPHGRPYADGFLAPVRINVRSVLALSPAARTAPRAFRFSGTIKSHPGDTVNLYRVDAYGRSVLTAQTTARAEGTYRIDRTFSGTGAFVFYTSSPSDESNVGGLSNRVEVAIR
jgi:hypothetical protein